jgi:hypothetical protein
VLTAITTFLASILTIIDELIDLKNKLGSYGVGLA